MKGFRNRPKGKKESEKRRRIHRVRERCAQREIKEKE